MLFDWFGQAEKTPPADKRHQPLRAKPQLEALEERFMPGAVRAIAGTNANSLPHEDDEPSPQANIGFTINFFGSQFNQVFVNNNGNITFGQAFPTFTPTALNSGNGGIPIIAPFFADVDTRVGPAVTYGQGTLCGLPVFAVNYIGVGYFDQHLNKTDSFQVVLIDRADTGAGNFDIEFNYDNIQWETGDASGGTNGLGGESAAVGFSNGTGNAGTFFELPGSHVNGALINGGPDALVSDSLLASTPGRFHFLVRNGNVTMAKVNNDVTNSTRLFYPFRYTADPQTQVETGNLTVININTATGTAACLDETTNNVALPGPINVVFTSIPSNLQLINPTGFTASGDPFITINVASLPPNTCARAQIQLLNTTPAPTTTFAQGFSARVFSGPFDPTML
jgi:hypothetical protein